MIIFHKQFVFIGLLFFLIVESNVIIADPGGRGYDFAKGIYRHVCEVEGREFPVTFADIWRTEFRDGEYKLRISHNVRRKKCFYVHDPNKAPTQWVTDLLFVLEAIKDSSPSEINVIFPYLRFARQDRKDESRVGVNVKAVADMVSFYANRGLTIDLHAPQIQEFFNIPFDNLFSSPVVINYLKRVHPELLNNLVVVSPDAGGGKRVESFQKRLAKDGIISEMAICYKRRARENEVEEIKIMGDVRGKNCFVVDDIIDTGGTLIKTGLALKEQGAERVCAYGTHGLFSDGTGKFGVFDKIMASDTLVAEKSDNFEVVSMTELFGEAVYRTIIGASLSSLFE